MQLIEQLQLQPTDLSEPSRFRDTGPLGPEEKTLLPISPPIPLVDLISDSDNSNFLPALGGISIPLNQILALQGTDDDISPEHPTSVSLQVTELQESLNLDLSFLQNVNDIRTLIHTNNYDEQESEQTNGLGWSTNLIQSDNIREISLMVLPKSLTASSLTLKTERVEKAIFIRLNSNGSPYYLKIKFDAQWTHSQTPNQTERLGKLEEWPKLWEIGNSTIQAYVVPKHSYSTSVAATPEPSPVQFPLPP